VRHVSGDPRARDVVPRGKQQLLRLVTDAMVAEGESFSLQRLHDRVWQNGNVPFSLQRWEILGDRSDLDAIEATPRAGVIELVSNVRWIWH
jgi:hypothetical protein